ncbi:MAG: phenylalanine--tRNA ligase subunit alpha [Lautropia sp.]
MSPESPAPQSGATAPVAPDLDALLTDARALIGQARDDASLADAKARYLGRNGELTALLKAMAALSGPEKAARGQSLNRAKQQLESLVEARAQALRDAALERRLASERIDVTLPGRGTGTGSLHPITLTIERIERIFRSIGFDVADGPEIEQDYFNFTALNMPADHPARSMHDTFYVESPAQGGARAAGGAPSGGSGAAGQPLVLRTHTSPMQIRYARSHRPPIKVIAPGKTYRIDSDATHSPMFHQFEGMWIDEHVSFADLKSVYTDFLHRFFEREDIDVRFRPSYFPFTEPSAEIDMRFGDGPLKGRWIEISGSGQVHPNVVRNIGLDPERYIGFAFGSGIERLAMLRYGVDDLRLFFENDLRFLRQFA